MRKALRIGRLFGIEFRVDSSWLFIFALVIWSLSSLFGVWHPDWAMTTRILVAVAAALAFFASVLFHEMAHSLVARLYNIPVRDITLHMFGGVSNIEKEPPTPGAEFLIAVVGPLASIGLGLVLMFGGATIAGIAEPDATNPTELIARLGPVTTVVMWLGPVNVIVGLFNMIPGFPLDGGRILRSILWKATGSLQVATRWSTTAGQFVGWGFIVMGAFMVLGYSVPFFGSGFGGLWLALIGFFLKNAAVQHQAGAALTEELAGVRVSDLMRRQGPWVDANTPLEALTQMFVQNEERAFPVFDGARFAGIVSITDVRRFRQTGAYGRTRDVMTPLERLTVTTPDTELVEAIRSLGKVGVSELPVIADGMLVGILFDRDVARWIELRSAPPRSTRPRESHA
jgi:Zn-dependent protease